MLFMQHIIRISLTLILVKLNWNRILAQMEQDLDKLNQLRKKVQGVKWRSQASELTSKFKELLKPILRIQETSNIEPYHGSILDYPKPNEFKKLKIFELSWNQYYECLKSQYASLGPDKVFSPQAIMIFERSNLRLTCDLCMSPDDITEKIQWYYSSTMQEELATELVEDSSTIISQYDNTLHIFSVQKSKSGLYRCHFKNTQSTTYFVHVVDKEPMNSVRPPTAPSNHSLPPVKNTLYGITIWNDWTSWSKCSHCGNVGKKVRTGYCMVTLTENLNIVPDNKRTTAWNGNTSISSTTAMKEDTKQFIETKSAKNFFHVQSESYKQQADFDAEFSNSWSALGTIFSTEPRSQNNYYRQLIHSNIENNRRVSRKQKVKRKIHSSNNQFGLLTKPTQNDMTKNKDLAMLRIFDGGIPCRSHLLPDSIRNLPEVSSRTTDVMVAFCKEPCIESVIFQVYDTKGKIIEEVNNTAGLYSTLQDLPAVVPLVNRQSMTVKLNQKNLKIVCPGNIHEDIPVEWQIKSKPLNPNHIQQKTDGRIIIDLFDRIVFKSLETTDANLYSCWQNKELVGVVALFIDQKLPFEINKHFLFLGVIPVTIIFTICLYRVFKLRYRGFS